jgi:hypothetical protein
MLHHGQDALLSGAGVEIGMDPQHLVDLAADRHHRIERGHRLLKDHRHGGGAQLAQPAVAGAEQFLADQFDAAGARHQRVLRQQAHHGQRGHGFSRSAFADQAQRFAGAYLQRDAVDDARVARAFAEADHEIVDVENGGFHYRSPPSLRGALRDEAIHSFFPLRDGLLRRIRLRPKAGFGGQEGSSQ